MAEAFKYDVFISHSSKDKPAVRELAKRLKKDGLRVWLDDWEIQLGDIIGLKVEQGLEQSRTLILVMSASALSSEWVTLERHTAMFRDPTNAERRFIPLRLDDTEIKDTLKQFAYVDWRQRSDEQYSRLLTACRPPVVATEPAIKKKGVSQPGKILKGHTNAVWGVAVTADGRRAISSSDDKTVRVWNVETGKCLVTLEGHIELVRGVAITADGRRAVSGSEDNTVRVWDVETGKCLATLEGHTDTAGGVAVTADGRRVVSGSNDKTVRVWNVETGKCLATLEGHTKVVIGVAITADGRRVVSGSYDATVRVWDVETGKCLATLEGHTEEVWGVAVTADGQRAVSGSWDETVRVWELPPYDEKATKESVATRYTNAKVLLVGESGVGKTGLAYRLTEDRFEPTISTDAAWATQLKLPHETGGGEIEREIWLWDFAGQADYRLIHQLFMDETALAVLVFNPQSENPFEGLGQWDSDLQRAARRPFRKLLAAGRCDRGGLMVSRASIETFSKQRGFTGYLETSAYTGDGCTELREAIINNIPWDDIPWTASPRIFKLLKEEIVKLKDEGKVLLRVGELRQQLEMQLPGETFTLEQLRAVVGLLAGPGIVWQLEFGDFVLLHPERINSYAAAVIRKVRAHTEEIGIIREEDALAGKLDYQDMKRLPQDEEQIVLRAMHQTFIDHGLCLREPTEAGTLLVFPSYFKRERPELEDYPAVLVTYQFTGQLDEIYSTLVVRLHHTSAFEKDQLWRFAADFNVKLRLGH